MYVSNYVPYLALWQGNWPYDEQHIVCGLVDYKCLKFVYIYQTGQAIYLSACKNHE